MPGGLDKFVARHFIFRSLRIKLIVFVNAFILLVIFLISMILIQQEKKSQLYFVSQQARNFIRNVAVPIQTAFNYNSESFFQNPQIISDMLVKSSNSQEGLQIDYIHLTDENGRILFSTNEKLLSDTYKPLGKYDLSEPISTSIIRNQADEEMMEAHLLIRLDEKLMSHLWVGVNLSNVEAQLSRVATNILLITISIFFFIFLILGGYIDIHIRPLTQMSALMDRVSRGDLSPRIAWESNDEIGILASTFNKMMDALQEARRKEKATIEKLCQTEKIAAIGLLASGVAHEINNPLSGILSCINTMAENIDDKKTVEKYITLVQDGVVRIERIVKQLLEFSRQRPFMPSWVSLEKLFHETTTFLQYQIRRRNIDIEENFAPESQDVFVDPHQIQQVMTNLMLNAIQSMPTGGKLSLTTSYQNGYAVFSVEDTGEGIPEENMRQIFHPFFTTRDVGKGTGLGLSVSLGIVESHGGRIDVKSSEEGTIFTVTIPINPVEKLFQNQNREEDESSFY